MLGFTAVLSKLIDWPTLVTVASRSLIAMGCITLFLIVKNKQILISKSDRLEASKSGLFLAIHWFTYFKAVEYSGIAIGLASLFTFPIITALIEPFWTKSRMVISHIISAIICLVGIIILLHASMDSPKILTGIGIGILSAMAYTFRNLISKPLLSRIETPQLMLHQVFISSMCFLLVIPITDISLANISFSLSNIVYALLLGSFFTGLAHTLFIHGFQYFSASFVSILAAAQPFYGTLLGILIVQEQPAVSTWIGGGFILLAIIYATLSQSKTMAS